MKFNEYHIDKVIPLNNILHYNFLIENIKNAKKTIFASVFIIDPLYADDSELKVRNLIKELGAAKKRRVVIKVIQSGSTTSRIFTANYVAYHYLKIHGIEPRIFSSKASDDLHSKYCLIDQNISIIGSSNWSPGGFSLHKEDSIAIYSKELNSTLAKRFESNFKTSKSNFNIK